MKYVAGQDQASWVLANLKPKLIIQRIRAIQILDVSNDGRLKQWRLQAQQ
jgi:hypothetical protein